MKKFILAALTSTMLFPAPILAVENMDEVSVSENFEEMDTVSLNQENSPVELNETTPSTIKIQFEEVNDDNTTKNYGNQISIRTGNNSVIDLIGNIPREYYFIQDPSTLVSSLKDGDKVQIKKIGTQSVPKPSQYNGTTPIYVTCQERKNDPIQIITLTGSDKVDNKGKISADSINTELKNNNIPYTVKNGLDYAYLDPICYSNNSQLKIIGYRNISHLGLTQVSDDVFDAAELTINFGKDSAKVYIQDLKPTNGKITLNARTLEDALNNYAKDKDKNPKITYKVSKLASNITFNAYGLKEGYTFTDAQKKDTVVYAILSEDTPVSLTVNNSIGGSQLIQINNLTLKDLGLKTSVPTGEAYGTINDKTAEVRSYFTKNYNKLEYVSCNFYSHKFAVDLTNADTSTLSTDEISGDISAKLKDDPSTLYTHEYTLVFENSSKPGEIVDRDKRQWKAFFKNGVSTTLKESDFPADVLPKGWKISAVQQAGSTEKKKKEVAEVSEAASINKGELELSIFSSDEIKVYVYGGKMPSNGGGGSSSEEPEEPTTPDTPMTPEDPTAPSIPSKGSAVMYRLFNPTTNEHLYTQDPAERDNLLNSGEWNNEGHGWTAPAVSSFPVYRVFNPNSGEHHYTKDKNEYDTLVNLGWTGEGKAFFSADDLDSKVTLFRLYNPSAPEAAQHHYTVYESERDDLIKDGWKFEGTAWYGLPMN